MIQIEKIEKSNRKNKKLKAILSDGKEVHFGLEGSLLTQMVQQKRKEIHI